MMDSWQFHLIDLVKISLPAFIVYLTAQHLIQKQLETHQQNNLFELKQEQSKITLPLKMQAYERLALFCDRIFLPSLLIRVFKRDATAVQLKSALLLQIQQEYEHNITQQVYVSDALWKIILVARDEVVQTIIAVSEGLEPGASAEHLRQAILQAMSERNISGSEKAQEAIRKEIALYL